MHKEARRILVILFSIIILFLSLVLYLTWFQIFKAETIKKNNYNKRQWIHEEKILRGSIYDRNGLELAYSEKSDEASKRVYKYGPLYSHIIGYSYREYGKTGIEASMNKTLLGLEESTTVDEIKNLVKDERIGNSLVLSIDNGMQERAHSLLKDYKGAVVVMNPETGEIYSMLSYPDYRSDKLKEDWQKIIENPNSPLLNRASQGLYEPGSSFKIISAAAIKQYGLDEDYYCKGSSIVDGYEFKDYSKKPHGKLNLETALSKSCNSYFVDKTLEIGQDRFSSYLNGFYINKEIPIEVSSSPSRFNSSNSMEDTELAASGIGQGKLLVTPLNMALVTGTVANGGRMVKPSLIKEIRDPENKIIDFLKPELLSSPMTEEIASDIEKMMISVVDSGTGNNARIAGHKIAGKTGTAENSSGKSHAWFVGYAADNDRKFVTVVVLEEAGSTGGKLAAPIARELIKYGIDNIK